MGEMVIMRRMLVVAVVVGILSGMATGVGAGTTGVPQMINYQGRLVDAGGSPVTGSHSITLAIYDADTGGPALWSEIHPSVSVDNGVFHIIMGSVTPIELSFGDDYWLGVTVDTDSEMTPRQRLVSVGYAFKANTANALADGVDLSLDGDADVTGTLTASGLAYPASDGTAGQILSTDGAGNLSWTSPGGTGDVTGPSSATDDAVARFDETSGKLIQNSAVTIDDSGNVDIGGTLDVTGATTLDSTLAVTGAVTFDSTLDVDGATTLDQVTIDTTDGDFTVTGTNNIDLNPAGNVAIDSSGGTIGIGTDDDTGAINIGTSATGRTITVGNASSTEVEINSLLVDINAGTFDLDATGPVTLDTTDTTDGLKLGTGVSGVPVTIGHSTSEVTISDNLNVGGDLAVSNDLTVNNNLNVTGIFDLGDTGLYVSEISAPGTPDSGKGVVYTKTDGKLYFKNDTGTELDLTFSGGAAPNLQAVCDEGTSTTTGMTITGAAILNGGLTMDTDKFTVADTTGNTAIGGTLGVTGATTLTGGLTASELAYPTSDGTSGQVLKTNGSGTLSWTDDGGASALDDLSDAKTSTGSVFLGTNSGLSNDSGNSNVGVGTSTLIFNVSGNYNTAGGYNALYYNTGSNNTAFGCYALQKNTSGGYNTGIGYYAIQENTEGTHNIALGQFSLEKNTTGSRNVALGGYAGRFQADGTTALANPENSIYIGYETRGNNDDDSNSIVIGYQAIGLGANTVVLGNDSITTTALKGNVGIGTTSPSYKLDVTGAGNFTSNLTVGGDLTVTGAFDLGDTGLYISEISAPGTPDSGKGVVYTKDDGKLYFKNDDGTELDLTFSGGAAPNLQAVCDEGTSTTTGMTITGAAILNGGLTMDTDKFTVADTTGNTAIAGTLDVNGATTLDQVTISTADGAFSVAGANAVDLNPAGNVTIDSSSGTIGLGTDANTGAINVGTSATARTITVGNASSTEVEINALLIDLNSGAMTIDASSLSLDSSDTSNLTMTANNASDKTLTIAATNAGVGKALIDIDGDGQISLDTTDTGNGLKLGTATSGVPVSIGHTTSEVTINDNATITGTLTASGLSYPSSDGTGGYFLSTNGSGTLSWAAASGGSPTLQDVCDEGTSTTTGMTITGAAILNGGLTMDTDKFTVADTTGNTAIAGTLDVDGAATLDQVTINTTDGAFAVSGSNALSLSTSNNAANAIYLRANGGINETIKIHADQGTGVSSITLVSDAGGIDVDAANDITIDTTDTTDGIKLGTATSGVPITIGHSTSEVTINDNATITGDLDVNGTTTLGNGTTASGDYSIAMGNGTTASGESATAMGASTTAQGANSTAMGGGTIAVGECSTAMGDSTQTDGNYAFAMGSNTAANGNHSFAMGNSTTAVGECSFAIGQEISADGDYTVAIALNDQNSASVSQANTMAIMGGKVGIDTLSPGEKLDVVGNVALRGQGELKLKDSDSSHYVAFKAPATVASNVTLTLPADDGDADQALVTNGSGTLSWADAGGSVAIDDLTDGITDATSVFLGSNSGVSDDGTTNENVALGVYALNANTSGNGNVAVGSNALKLNTTGSSNVAIGRDCLDSNTTGSQNVAIGNSSLKACSTAGYNIAIGHQSLYNNTRNGNIGIGLSTLQANTTGMSNVAVGTLALTSNVTGSLNTALGDNALRYNTANCNTAVGSEALVANTSGATNTGVGQGALNDNTTGSRNTALGYNTLGLNTTGGNNTALGCRAGYRQADGSTSLLTPENSVYIGYDAMGKDDDDDNSIVIGYEAIGLGANTVVLGNDSITLTALKGDVQLKDGTSAGNIAFYEGSGSGTNKVTIQSQAMGADYALTLPADDGDADQVLTTNGSGTLSWAAAGGGASEIDELSDAIFDGSSLYLGLGSGGPSDDGSNVNTAIGLRALSSNTSGSSNVAVGVDALKTNTTGYTNVAIGRNALLTNSTGASNIAIGQDSLKVCTDSSNVAIGYASLAASTSGDSNIAIGSQALFQNTTGDDNVAIGRNTLDSNTVGQGNAAVGLSALGANISGHYNTTLGNGALCYNTTGGKNTALGYMAGRRQADGSTDLVTPENSVYIGYNAMGKDDDDDNSIVIGYEAIGLGANTVVLGNDSITTTALKGDVQLKDGTSAGNIAFYEGSGSGTNKVTIQSQAMGADYALTLPADDGDADQALTTDGSGTLSWASAGGGSGDVVGPGSSGTDAIARFDGNTGKIIQNSAVTIDDDGNVSINPGTLYVYDKVGFGEASPVFRLNLDNDGGIIAQGAHDLGTDLPDMPAMPCLIWYPKKSAFRAGYHNGTVWEDANVGEYSAALNGNCKASGEYSLSTGYWSSAESYCSTAIGYQAVATGSYAISLGGATTASGQFSLATGINSVASGDYSTAMGRKVTAEGNYTFGIGLDTTSRTITQANTMAIVGGVVGICMVNPSVELDVTGDIEYTGTCSQASDERLKENIEPVRDALEKVRSIEGVYYSMIDNPGTKEVGFIAQNVQEALPEVVKVIDPETGYLGINYNGVLPVLLEAVKELEREKQEQQEIIEELRERLEALEQR